MAETTIVFPNVSLMDAVEALLPTLTLPAPVESRVEPAMDYPGQQVAIDLYADTDEILTAMVETVRDALFHQFRIPTRTSSELERVPRHSPQQGGSSLEL
ncbi:MAG: hypothetical protein ACRDQA_25200 [Nocardioidaceae bacterium]